MSLWHPRCRAQISVIFDGRGGPDIGPILVEAEPKTARVSLNGYSEADTAGIEFDLRLLPLDPNLFRAATAAVYMWSADTFDEAREWAVPQYQMILGFVSEGAMAIDRDRQVARMEIRDYTALLTDRPWDTHERLRFGKPLDETIQAIADEAAPRGSSLRFQVVYESTKPAPIVGSGHRATHKRGKPIESGKSVFDVIYELALSYGFLVYVSGEELIVTDVTDQTGAGASSAPVLAYGRNLRSLEANRRFGKERVPQVRVTAYDPRTRRRVRVIYPKRSESPDVGVGVKRDELWDFPAPPGVYDRGLLRRHARLRYEAIASAETAYSFTTRHLRDEEGGQGRDLLRLRAGAPVSVQFDPFNAESFHALTFAQRVEHLQALGYEEAFSGVVAQSYERLQQFSQPYYLRRADYDWSLDDGLVISGEAVNYAYEPRELAEQRSPA